MDPQQVSGILKDLGIPAVISAFLLGLVKLASDALERRSKQSLLDWLAQPSTTEPFKGDDKALRALHELEQLLVFEKAFGLKAEATVRNELLLFAESQHEFFRFQEVLDAGRLLSRLSLAQLGTPKQIKMFKIWSRLAKLAAYSGFVVGYIIFCGYGYLVMTGDFKELRSAAGGLVFGGLMALVSLYNFKNARRLEIAAAFLTWHSENQRGSFQAQLEHIPSENSHSAEADVPR